MVFIHISKRSWTLELIKQFKESSNTQMHLKAKRIILYFD